MAEAPLCLFVSAAEVQNLSKQDVRHIAEVTINVKE